MATLVAAATRTRLKSLLPAHHIIAAELQACSRARLDYAASAMFPSPAYMRRRYGVRLPLLLPLYYPYRWGVGLSGLIARRRAGG